MNRNLFGKKLLLLGGMLRSTYLVKQAQKLGVYVVVADDSKISPAKEIANEAVMMDVTDVNAIVDYCKNNNIEGIITAHTDLLLKPYYEATKLLDLPCYLTEEMIEVSTNKESFNQMCIKYDISVPKSVVIDINSDFSLCPLDFPVFIKPLDGSGSRGASACYNIDKFQEKCLDAFRYSKKNQLIIEELLTGTDFGVDYLIFNGEVYLLSMHDRQVCDDRPSAINHSNLQILPSKFLTKYLELTNHKVVDMLKDMGFKNGIVFFQGFVNSNTIKFFEMGCRFGSTWNYIDEYFIGVNPLDILIEFSLTGVMPLRVCNRINPKFNGYGAVISLLTEKKEGKISKIIGIEKVSQMPGVKCIMQEYKEGDYFSMKNRTDITLLRVQLVAINFNELIGAINLIYETVDFYDENAKSILSSVYSTDLLNYN